jgi:ribulokinase
MAASYVMAIDVGTRGLRAMIFDLAGRAVGSAGRQYRTWHDHAGWAEQEPNDWWDAAVECSRRALAESGVPPATVVGLSVAAASCTVLPVKANGMPLRRALLWMDVRSAEQAAKVTRTKHPVLKYVGWVESAEWMLPKALWLKEQQPAIYEQADYLVESLDYMVHRLTGQWVAALDQATSKWHFAQPEGGWPLGLLKQLGVSELPSKWPEKVLPIGAPVGPLTAEAAAELGLTTAAVVAQGGIGAHLAMLGVGVVTPGQMAVTLGSSTCHLALCDSGLFGSHVWGPYPDAVLPGLWLLEGGQTTTGAIADWFRDEIARDPEVETAAAAVPPGAEGLVMLGYFQGNRAPWRDARARGAFIGLSLHHGRGHLARAIIEGNAFGTRHILDDLRNAGFRPEGIYACGPGARSALALQIHADICGLPLYLTRTPEATCLGAALAAATGAGSFGSLTDAARQMVQVERRIEPNRANAEVYDFLFRQYQDLYPPLADTMHDLADRF